MRRGPLLRSCASSWWLRSVPSSKARVAVVGGAVRGAGREVASGAARSERGAVREAGREVAGEASSKARGGVVGDHDHLVSPALLGMCFEVAGHREDGSAAGDDQAGRRRDGRERDRLGRDAERGRDAAQVTGVGDGPPEGSGFVLGKGGRGALRARPPPAAREIPRARS